MSIVGLLCLLFALVASLLLVLYWVQRREIRSVEQLSQQVQRIAIGGRLEGRVDLQSDQPEITALTTAVNHLLTRVAATNERDNSRATPKLFAELGDRIHEAVLVHRDVILYANRQFATFVGVDRVELVGRRLGDLVPPEYSELVNENIRRRFAHEPAAERYEIEMVGLQGQVSRLEITTACCAKLRRCFVMPCATAIRLRASAVTSLGCCSSAVRWRKRGRSPMTCAVPWAITALSGRTRFSTLACPSGSSRSRARAARSRS